MAFSAEHTIPWELISGSFQEQLGPEETTQLELWISTRVENEQLYDQLKKIWQKDLDDYQAYRLADENSSWERLRLQLEEKEQESPTVIVAFNRPHLKLMRWAAVAAILVLAFGSYFLYMFFDRSQIYQTGENEQQNVLLPDGSHMTIFPESKISIDKNYNKEDRLLSLSYGKVFFDVKHNERIVFIVDLGNARVKDVGTSFYIRNIKDSVDVSVKTGEVLFTNNITNKSTQLTAGMNLKQYPGKNGTDPVIKVTSELDKNQHLLEFENIELTEVILKLEAAYLKKIILVDSAIAGKRFKADLKGQSFENAIEILCKSLRLEYFVKNDVYYLKSDTKK